jgi:hypothetical protein
MRNPARRPVTTAVRAVDERHRSRSRRPARAPTGGVEISATVRAQVSTYPPPAYDSARIEIVSELRWEESEPESVAW